MAFEELNRITQAMPLAMLTRPQVRELQSALSLLGYPLGDIDGLVGPKTRAALAEFKVDIMDGRPEMVGPNTVARLAEMVAPMQQPGADDYSTKEGTIRAIRRQCEIQDLGLKTQIAYVLATTQWETAQTFKQVREAFWMDEAWRKRNFRYYPYYGRGYVQLTWKDNYQKYGELLGIDLVRQPDLAMEPATAAFILVHGFKTGTFTGRKLTDYVNRLQTDFINARRCINGTDRAHDIARLADAFLQRL